MYNTFWWHALFVRGQQFSVKTFDRSRNSYQEIRLGVENDFWGLPGRCSLTPHMSPSRAPILSCTHYFQVPATQARSLDLGLACFRKSVSQILKMPLEECKVLAIHFFLLKNNLTTCQSGQYKSANIFPPALPPSFYRYYCPYEIFIGFTDFTITLIGYFPCSQCNCY